MKYAIVGCGYVADQYMASLPHCTDIELVAAHDILPERTQAFCEAYGVKPYDSLEALLKADDVEMVVNLTNPRSHQAVNEASIRAGKHVYSEKPLGMTLEAAQQIVALAQEHGVRLASAPCNMLGRTAQTVWKAVREGAIGQVRLVYADYDGGMIAPHKKPWNWTSKTGAHWPAKDEFEIGCTFEHAGYLLTCLVAMFGPVKAVTSFASCLLPEKGIPVDEMAPDFTVGCLEFEGSPVVARVTNSIVAPRSKAMTVIGDAGIITVDRFRDDKSTVYIQRYQKGSVKNASEQVFTEIRRGLDRFLPWIPWGTREVHLQSPYPFATDAPHRVVNRRKRVDFSSGPRELAAAVREDRPCRLDGTLGVHVVELINALQYPKDGGERRIIETRVDPIEPLVWR